MEELDMEKKEQLYEGKAKYTLSLHDALPIWKSVV